MRLLSKLSIIVAFCMLAVFATPLLAQDEQPSLGDVARQNQRNKANQPPARPEVKTLVDESNAEHEDSGGEPQASVDVKGLLFQHHYDELEKAAGRARINKTRTKGGLWQLYLFYNAVDEASRADAQVVTELKKWVAAHPESLTARVALAQAYIALGFHARGSGYANAVTQSQWAGLANGAELALDTIREASRIGTDPHMYFVLMEIAVAEGWDKQQTRSLFERALSEEPDYYHTFREYANYLLPKWYGDEFEAESLGEELYQRVGGRQGLFLYFEIATVIGCDCSEADAQVSQMSWDRIKQGYAALQELYGANNRDNNRFLRMAVAHKDKAAAQPVAAKIGDDWEDDIWRSRASFETARAWALAR